MKTRDPNWIISAYHAENGNNKEKWEKVNSTLDNLNDAYKWPKVVYLDINTDVNHQKFKEWESTLPARGWNIHKSNEWTRKGKARQKVTNIDIILTHNVPSDRTVVKTGRFNEIISDHKPIYVDISNLDFISDNILERDLIIDKGKLK